MISELQLTNFKSITNEPIKLGNLNACIGANASGKSSFVDSLQFIRDIKINGLASAIAHRYGWQNTLRRGLDPREKISAKIKCD
jgi:AAA15 family ATPase/GTPase